MHLRKHIKCLKWENILAYFEFLGTFHESWDRATLTAVQHPPVCTCLGTEEMKRVQHTQGNFRNLDSLTPKSAVRINGHMKLVINFPLFVQKKAVALTAVWLGFEKDRKTKLLERTRRGQTQIEGSKALYFKFFGQQNNSKLTILSSCIINSQTYHKAIKVP